MEVNQIMQELKKREQQIDRKLDKILSMNLNPFPFERIQKAKNLLALISQCKKLLDEDRLIEAGICIKTMEIEGLNLFQWQEKLK
jgi:CRISPR/Cas system-associated protein Csx1